MYKLTLVILLILNYILQIVQRNEPESGNALLAGLTFKYHNSLRITSYKSWEKKYYGHYQIQDHR